MNPRSIIKKHAMLLLAFVADNYDIIDHVTCRNKLTGKFCGHHMVFADFKDSVNKPQKLIVKQIKHEGSPDFHSLLRQES